MPRGKVPVENREADQVATSQKVAIFVIGKEVAAVTSPDPSASPKKNGTPSHIGLPTSPPTPPASYVGHVWESAVVEEYILKPKHQNPFSIQNIKM